MIFRRDFLKRSVATAAQGIATGTAVSAGLSAGISPPVRAQGLGTDYDVIIIGAGVAGLAAAEYLGRVDSDLKVLVLEARDRIGGRIHSVDVDPLSRDAELGAQYILHQEGADWPLLGELDLSLKSLPDDRLTLSPGMSAMAEALAEASTGKVQLSSAVDEIFWREGLVGVSYVNQGLSSAVSARRLLVTIPAGVMRNGGPRFNPELPDSKRQALGELQSEHGISCAMAFSADHAQIIGEAEEWVKETQSTRLRAFRAGPADEVLLEAQYRGVRAEALAGQDQNLLMALSLQSFKEALVDVPSAASAIWQSTADWKEDPYSRGAATIAAATSTHLNLAQSLSYTLYFAGEATADPSEVGTVHGAYASGQRAAREVAASFGLEDAALDANEPVFELL